MSKTSSRRGFPGASAAAVSSLANPGLAAARGAGVKPADLPDLTIEEVRVYHIDTGRGATQIAGIVTSSAIEGNYSLAARYWPVAGGCPVLRAGSVSGGVGWLHNAAREGTLKELALHRVRP